MKDCNRAFHSYRRARGFFVRERSPVTDCRRTGLHHRLDHLFTMQVLEDSFGHAELHSSYPETVS